MRKRWRYVAAFQEDLMLCAARVQVGPFAQTFWALLDRPSGELIERTRTRLPWSDGEVQQPNPGELGIATRRLRGTLSVGSGTPWEATCANDGNEVWTCKQAGVPVKGELRATDGRSWKVDALGVVDETDGHHPRDTVWSWSAGVGTTADGRQVGWNLVEGINDPASGSERAIWLDGEPQEAPPSRFDGLAGIDFDDGARLNFTAEAERSRHENKLLLRYSYRQPFGTFTGALPGGIELASATGVMEHHDAHW